MAVEKKKGSDEEDDDFEEDHNKKLEKLQKVELGDFVKVKQVLDESVVKAVLELDYTENHYWDNIKLILMVVACLFAMVAQFYPMPFPESRPLLGVCCGAYFIASSILQLIVTYVEKECIMITGPIEDAEGRALPLPPRAPKLLPPGKAAGAEEEAPLNTKRAGGGTGLRICTTFPRFSYDYTVAVYNNVKEDPATGLPTGKHSSMRFKIHDYFTEEGHFDDLRFESHVQVVVKDFQEGVHYTDKAWANVSDKVKKTN